MTLLARIWPRKPKPAEPKRGRPRTATARPCVICKTPFGLDPYRPIDVQTCSTKCAGINRRNPEYAARMKRAWKLRGKGHEWADVAHRIGQPYHTSLPGQVRKMAEQQGWDVSDILPVRTANRMGLTHPSRRAA